MKNTSKKRNKSLKKFKKKVLKRKTFKKKNIFERKKKGGFRQLDYSTHSIPQNQNIRIFAHVNSIIDNNKYSHI